MQKKKKITIFSLWEVKVVLLSLVLMIAAVPVACVIRGQQRVQEAKLEEERLAKLEEERILQEKRESEAEVERQKAAVAESERIAAGPIVKGTNSEGQEIYTVDYSLGTSELSLAEESSGYSEVTNLTEYVAYTGGDYRFCYPKNLYTKVENEDKGGPMDTWRVTTFSAEDGSRLITEYQTTTMAVTDEVFDKLLESFTESYQIGTEKLEKVSTENGPCLYWRGTDSAISRGIICANGGRIWKMTILCPASVDEEDARRKNFYVDSMFHLSPLGGTGAQTLSWDSWQAQ